MVRLTPEYRAKLSGFNNRRTEILTNYAIFKEEQKLQQEFAEELDESL